MFRSVYVKKKQSTFVHMFFEDRKLEAEKVLGFNTKFTCTDIYVSAA